MPLKSQIEGCFDLPLFRSLKIMIIFVIQSRTYPVSGIYLPTLSDLSIRGSFSFPSPLGTMFYFIGNNL